jgi:tetratricopeptide (TPR) repeat protein
MRMAEFRYEAKLNAEVEKLKLGDRAAAADSAATAAASSSPAAAASSSAASAADSASAAAAAPSASPSSSDDVSASASAPITAETVLEKDVSLALAAKARGNQHYARQQYDEAIAEYSRAIAHCPVGEDAGAEEAKDHLAVFFSNRAAAFLMQSRHAECVADASASLSLQPTNAKALSRRAKAHEALDQLAEAVEDLKALVALDASDRDAAKNLVRVEKALNEKNENMKAEMLGKLKDFGNTILGKFGMSLDNFKAQQDPATGSYNISFGK